MKDNKQKDHNHKSKQSKSSSDSKKKNKRLALGLSLGIGIPVVAGAVVGIVLGLKGCSNNPPAAEKMAVDIRTNPGNTIYTNQKVTASKSVVLGSFRLIDSNGNVVTENKSSEITLAFTTPNQTGFNDENLSFVFNDNDNTYQVSLISGTAGSEPCSGSVSITWKSGGKTISSPSQLDVHIIDVTKKTLSQKVLGADCKTEYNSEQVVPVVVGSGIYLELTDPDTKNRIDANWMVLGGGTFVELLNTETETPINALMVNVAPDTEEVITVKAFPTDSVLYNDAVFSIKIQASATEAIITAQEQSSHYLLQYQTTQVIANDVIHFTLNNQTATSWEVVDATGGDRLDPAATTDVSFDSADPDGILTIKKAFVVGATYTIQATYGDNLTTKFDLLLIAGGVINGTIKQSTGEETPIQKNRQLSNDLAIGDVLTFNLTDYSGQIEYWTAVYDARTPYSIPGFSSPISGDKKTVVWTVTQNDMDFIPAASHIYFRAYKANSSSPVATFIFQTKAHVLTKYKYANVDLPKTYNKSKFWGCKETFIKNKFTALLDEETATYVDVNAKILPSTLGDYRVEDSDTEISMIIQKGGGANITAPIELSYKMPSSGVLVVGYSSIELYGVWDLYSFDKQSETGSVDLNISKSNYVNASSDGFVLYKNGEPCVDDCGVTWTKNTITNVDLDNGPADVNNYDIAYDEENKCWKVDFTAGGTAPTAVGQTGTLTFTAKYPGADQPSTTPTYPFPEITINIKTV